MKIIKDSKGKSSFIETREVSFDDLSILKNDLSQQILSKLSYKSMYPKQLAKELKLHEQNVYYYIRKLERSNLIEVEKEENINGTVAKFYKLTSDSFFIKVKDFKEGGKVVEKDSSYLSPFIKKGEMNSLIIVGSPDPHGPHKARSRDGYFGMDLALFLGTFLTYLPESRVRLDTEVSERELKENNLIVIGGPIVNKIASEINREMPIYYDEEKKGIFSTITNRTYQSEEVGMIVKSKSKYNKDKEILLLTGLRNQGTKACMLAFLKNFSELKKGNNTNREIHARVIEGIDYDSDGQVDDVEFLE